MVRYFDHNKTYVEARRHCVSQNSRLLEIWNEEEWNEVQTRGFPFSYFKRNNVHYPVDSYPLYKLFWSFRSLSGLVRLWVPSLFTSLASLIWTLKANLFGDLGVSYRKMLQPFGNQGSLITTMALNIVHA